MLRACLPESRSIMNRANAVRQQLLLIETTLRNHQQWQGNPPDAAAFASDQPFCLDTLAPYEWLQWIFIPRMHALLDSDSPLPQAFSIAPYYEVALHPGHPAREDIIALLQEMDAWFSEEKA